MSLSLGGQCMCCGCARCADGPTTVQATFAGIANLSGGCNSTPGCDDINGTYVLTYEANATLPDDILTASEDTTGCKWSAAITAIECSKDSCDACECEYTFSDDTGGYTDETCDGLCNPDPVEAEMAGNPGDGVYITTPDADCATCLDEGCEYGCGDETEPGACSCVSDMMGGWMCSCGATCECTTTCTPDAGWIEVYLYRKATTLEAVLFVRVLLPNDRYLSGEVVMGASTVNCTDEFNPETITLTQYGSAGGPYCTDPASIDVEFL